MKVLVLTTTFPRWKDDPTPAFVYELSKRLSEEGMEIVDLAPHHEGARFHEKMEGMKVYRFPYFYPTKCQRLCYEGGILPNLKRSWLAWVQVPFLILFELIFAYRIIQKEKIDVIHSHWIVPNGLVAGIIRKFWNIPHLSTAHAADVLALDKLPMKKILSTFILQNSDALTASSSYIKERLEKMAGNGMSYIMNRQIFVQPMGVDTKMFEGLDKISLRNMYSCDARFIILFVGRFVEKKGVEYLLESMKFIVPNNNNVKLLLVGGGPLEERLRKRTEELNLNKNVEFIGKVSKDKLAQLYSLSDVVVVPSIIAASGDTEGMPTVIVEAMAAGKPVIASDVGGIKDVVIDGFNGFLVEPRRTEILSSKIFEIINNPLLRDNLSKNALITGRNHDWSKVAKIFNYQINFIYNPKKKEAAH